MYAAYPQLWTPGQKPPAGILVGRAHPLAAGLVGAWLFNEGAGFLSMDAVSGTLATLSANLGWQRGTVNLPNSSTSKVTLPDLAQYRLANPLTIAVRAQWNSAGGSSLGRFISREAATNSYNLLLNASTTALQFTNGGTALNMSGFTLATLTDFTIHVTQTGTTAQFYINGRPANSGTVGAGVTTAGAAYIGNRADGLRNFDGVIYWVMLWNRALSALEVATHYANPFAAWGDPLRGVAVASAAAVLFRRTQYGEAGKRGISPTYRGL